MMQQEFAISLAKLKWKPQLEGQQYCSNVVALAKARGRPRSCNFCCTSAWILMETTLNSALAIPMLLLIAGGRLESLVQV